MNRLLIIALTVIVTVALIAALIVETFFSVRIARGGEVVLMPNQQAQECDDSDGCIVLSKKQLQLLLMKIIGRAAEGGLSS